jgi:hypothetical protein
LGTFFSGVSVSSSYIGPTSWVIRGLSWKRSFPGIPKSTPRWDAASMGQITKGHSPTSTSFPLGCSQKVGIGTCLRQVAQVAQISPKDLRIRAYEARTVCSVNNWGLRHAGRGTAANRSNFPLRSRTALLQKLRTHCRRPAKNLFFVQMAPSWIVAEWRVER